MFTIHGGDPSHACTTPTTLTPLRCLFLQAMTTATFKKDDRIKSLATLYDVNTIDENGQTFSQRWAGNGNGEYCFGKVTMVYKKQSREPQKYKIRWDDQSTSPALHEHLLDASQDDFEIDPEAEEDDGDSAHISVERVQDGYDTEDEGGVTEPEGGEYVSIKMGETIVVPYKGEGTPPPLQPCCVMLFTPPIPPFIPSL